MGILLTLGWPCDTLSWIEGRASDVVLALVQALRRRLPKKKKTASIILALGDASCHVRSPTTLRNWDLTKEWVAGAQLDFRIVMDLWLL